jgi:hypothetical protein
MVNLRNDEDFFLLNQIIPDIPMDGFNIIARKIPYIPYFRYLFMMIKADDENKKNIIVIVNFYCEFEFYQR